MPAERRPEAERPRERLYWNGPEALADAELLAIQLGSGIRGKSAIDVAPGAVSSPALRESAASVTLPHNHPSGDPPRSREDVRLTRQLVECARLLDLRIHDHLVIGRGRFVSLAEKGII